MTNQDADRPHNPRGIGMYPTAEAAHRDAMAISHQIRVTPARAAAKGVTNQDAAEINDVIEDDLRDSLDNGYFESMGLTWCANEIRLSLAEIFARVAADAARTVGAQALRDAAAELRKISYDNSMLVGESPMEPGTWHSGNDFGRSYGLGMAIAAVEARAVQLDTK